MEMVGIKDHEVMLNVNGGDTIQNLTKTCFENITTEQRNALVELYKIDFAMFDYDPDLY